MNLIKRAKHYARTALQIFKNARKRKLLIRNQLEAHRNTMEPGVYRIGYHTAHRVLRPYPRPLKSSQRPPRRLSPAAYPIGSDLIYLLEIYLPPNFYYNREQTNLV